MPIGRPPEPVPEDIAAELEAWISDGKTLRDYCRQPGKPKRATIDSWRRSDEVFRSRIARARETGFDVIAEGTLEIADDGTNDFVERETRSGTVTVLRDEHVQRSKLRIETRLKLLAKWDPRRYGERVAVDGLGGAAIQISDEAFL